MIALVFFATVINYLDRQTLSVVAPVIVQEFHISNVDYSRIIFAFMLAYTIMNGISGPMIDRLGTKVGYAVCIGWWSIAAMLHSLAHGESCVTFFSILMTSAIPAVLVSDAFVSIGLISIATLEYTGALSNTLAMPADRFPKNTVGSVWGIASMGAGFGGMVFSLLTGWVVDHYSYVPVFIGFGILPLIAAAILWSLTEEVEATAASGDGS
jgi:MFS family permease